MKEKYRMENVQVVVLNGRKRKLFNAYEYDEDSNAYVHMGQFDAPWRTPYEKLELFID